MNENPRIAPEIVGLTTMDRLDAVPVRLVFRKPDAPLAKRGLCTEAQDTFHTATAGMIEFGNYFAVVTRHGTLWKWELKFPGNGNSIGWADSETEARLTLVGAYEEMLAAFGISRT